MSVNRLAGKVSENGLVAFTLWDATLPTATGASFAGAIMTLMVFVTDAVSDAVPLESIAVSVATA